MKTARKSKPESQAPRKRELNLTVDQDLATTFKQYCEMNRQAVSVSHQVENMMIRVLAQRGGRYGLRLPSHLISGK